MGRVGVGGGGGGGGESATSTTLAENNDTVSNDVDVNESGTNQFTVRRCYVSTH